MKNGANCIEDWSERTRQKLISPYKGKLGDGTRSCGKYFPYILKRRGVFQGKEGSSYQMPTPFLAQKVISNLKNTARKVLLSPFYSWGRSRLNNNIISYPGHISSKPRTGKVYFLMLGSVCMLLPMQSLVLKAWALKLDGSRFAQASQIC